MTMLLALAAVALALVLGTDRPGTDASVKRQRGAGLQGNTGSARPHTSPRPWYVTKQIRAATVIGRESGGDPWPNCPDPFDGGGPWWRPSNPKDRRTTLGCENGGSWLDSPGYYRCGLQFAPSWERRFGRLCP